MEPPVTAHDAISRDDVLVHNWRVSQLTRLGIPGSLSRKRRPLRQVAMPGVIAQKSAENMASVRRLLRERQPAFSAALELALMLAGLEVTSPGMPGQVSASVGS